MTKRGKEGEGEGAKMEGRGKRATCIHREKEKVGAHEPIFYGVPY